MNHIHAVYTVGKPWVDELASRVHELRDWLADEKNIDAALESITQMLVEKHHDYGEDNLYKHGEYGILVRSSDKLARLENLLDKEAQVKDENRAKTWMDLAGYAIQALILLGRIKSTEDVDIFAVRKNRLARGLCPDCGEGVLLRRDLNTLFRTIYLYCSDGCGFTAQIDAYDEDVETIHKLAGRQAVKEQK